MSKHINIEKEQFQQFNTSEINGPFQMLNLLKFKEKVEGTSLTGAAQYKNYMAAATPFFEKSNAKILYFGSPKMNLIGPTEIEWDKILIVTYASKADFLSMILSEGYPAEMRAVALEDARLVLCQ